MKKFELIFAFLQLPLDYVLLVAAGFTAYSLRFTHFMTAIRPVRFNLPWEKYWPLVLAAALGWVIIFAFNGLYHTNPNRKLLRDLKRVFFACSTGFAAIALYVFFTLQKFDSRFLVLAGWVLAIIYICAGRILMRALKILFYRLGIGLRQTVIIGAESIAREIGEFLTANARFGCALIGSYAHFDRQTAETLLKSKPDEIIFTDPKADEKSALEAIDFANEHHITFKYSADLFATISSNMLVHTIAGVPIIELCRTRLAGWNHIIKRAFDIAGSIFLIALFSPLLLTVAVIILMESGRPVIYKNARVGRANKKFFAYKFRSMSQKYCTGEQFEANGAEALRAEEKLIQKQSIKEGPVYKIKDDPRVTPFGRFIRQWSLDELPQLFNVLKGEMSLAGPRPHQPREVAKYQKWHRAVLDIKPGVTGLAQISGRSNLTFDEEAKLDTFYIEHWSLMLDIIILLKTPFVVLNRRGVY